MRLVADLHIHSRYSNATSHQMELPTLASSARRKGIDLLGTGDCTHPLWLDMLSADLREEADGVYSHGDVSFLVTGEVSLVWKHDGRGRRIHLVLLVPSLDDAVRIHDALDPRGNLMYDGRPMLGLSAPDFCELVWAQSPETLLVPAHVWTPWYSVFGAKSGFDALEECFGPHTDRIVAIETGLSSDPPMNRRISALDHLRLLSCSDAHSPAKLAREATLFDLDGDLTFASIRRALSTGEGYSGTLEFYPQEGKYHHDGHRACGIGWSPETSMAADDICPVCGKTLTIGVLHRVMDLADRDEPQLDAPYRSLIPLAEIISQAVGKGVNTKTVAKIYDAMLDRHGTELDILLEQPLDGIAVDTPDRVLQGIAKMRSGDIHIEPGHDGVYGKVEIPFGKD